MWIVYFADNLPHSAWNTEREATHQLLICKAAGMDNAREIPNYPKPHMYVKFDETVQTRNGHYYV